MKMKFAIVSAILLCFATQADADTCSAPLSPKAKGTELSRKLDKCNGVLKPGQAADQDIVKPTPKIDDPMTIHPKDLSKNGVAK
jgi:hypothetical protein